MLKDYKKLMHSKELKEWGLRNKEAYLSNCFIMLDKDNKGIWSFDYYLPKENKLTTFVVDEKITINQDQKIFNQSSKKLKAINVENIKFDLNKINKLLNKKFKGKLFFKKIFILQYLGKLLWNVSLLGSDFNLINVKIDALKGDVIEESTNSMLQFKGG